MACKSTGTPLVNADWLRRKAHQEFFGDERHRLLEICRQLESFVRKNKLSQAPEDPASGPSAGNNYYFDEETGIECCDAQRAAMSLEEYRGYLRGCAFKYLWRLGKKPGAKPADDINKAIDYLEKLRETFND